ncbi:TonB-dependent receptor plug domain-containing protein [Idiomarina aminovorans]|uniref:TonB-dependent receptor plug domain-containing protein n=1 Tax=Idiomarina aminovorans TaxID=2914829 RepID=UPI0020034387|nr:TonB-dependent receptor plug domain-containing protein [Idiomarina sp. ATCH4]MCK7458847.1 TonB-dependent receptor plug domain-containing protein [Idiomarina sp. ATCH4]
MLGSKKLTLSLICIMAAPAAIANQQSLTEEKDEKAEAVDERIEVVGYRWFPETLALSGRYDLSRDFLDFRSQGNGNITDMLTFLPGIQFSENALNADRQKEIRTQLISISGAQPWQTGFYYDGLSNNSRIDPNAAYRSPSSVNDVQGHPQNLFINSELVQQVTVFDSNIPASYGGFNGGVVDVESRSLNQLQQPQIKLSYRRSLSSWNEYTYYDFRGALSNEELEQQAETKEDVELPNFAKQTLGLSVAMPINEEHSFYASFNQTTSTIGEVSLFEPIETERESLSTLIKYSYTPAEFAIFDELSLSASYSPYEGEYVLTDVKDSRYSQEGGGYLTSVNVHKQWQNWLGDLQVGYSNSDNSRQAPNVYRPWFRAPGKDWGTFVGNQALSIEGGYGDLNKIQQDTSASLTLTRDTFDFIAASHDISLGISANLLNIERLRPNTSVVYNSPFRDANFNCDKQTLDCVEQQYEIPLEQLAEQLGGSIDLSNPEHLKAYQENLNQRGQFFRYRRVYPIENIDVQMQEYSAFVDDQLHWQDWDMRLGLRADYNDFLTNIDIAPRLQLGYRPFSNTRLIAGLNRYYAASLITYKLREARRPYLTQFRPLEQGVVGNWQTSAQAERFRYSFNDVSTPYNDEFSLAVKQRLFGGVFSIKGVKRWQYDQLARGSTRADDGITYITTTNAGSGEYQRLTLSYQYRWRQHEFWFHTSHSENLTSSSSYDSNVDAVPEDEIVAYVSSENTNNRFKLISLDDLGRLNDDFSRPLSANLSIHSQWTEDVKTSLNVSYQGKYTSAVNTGQWYFAELDTLCTQCDDLELAYPVYQDTKRPARTLLSANLQYRLQAFNQALELNLEIDNLLGQRTYTVADNQQGLETGRSFWVGVEYTW